MQRSTDHAVYEPVLRDVSSSSRLSDMERYVRETMATPGWEVLEELWGELERSLADKILARSGVPTHEEYVKAHGEVRGLRYALQAPKALEQHAQRARDEAGAHA